MLSKLRTMSGGQCWIRERLSTVNVQLIQVADPATKEGVKIKRVNLD